MSALARQRSSTGLTFALAALVLALAAGIFWQQYGVKRVTVASEIPVLDFAPNIRWQVSTLPDHPSLDLETWQMMGGGSDDLPDMASAPHETRITNLQIVDLDGDKRMDVLVCDAAANHVRLHRRDPDSDTWSTTVLASGLQVPAHATVVDIDRDGDNDVVVSLLGDMLPSDEVIGGVVLLVNDAGTYRKQTILTDIRRVADVQAGDLDGDGDVDLAVAAFGYARGKIVWLEQMADLTFRDHFLDARPGVVHVPVHDYDNDGDLDIATVVTQDEEEVWIYDNDGKGTFVARRVYYTHNFDVGGGGLVATDLDGDGDQDFLMSQGDNLEFGHGWPQPYHGCIWLENQGAFTFQPHQIGRLGGTYGAQAADFDGDGDKDVVLVSMSNDASNPAHPTVVWLENDGQNRFAKTWTVTTQPTELICVDCGDLDGDGRIDVAAGRLRVPMSASPIQDPVSIWYNRKNNQ